MDNKDIYYWYMGEYGQGYYKKASFLYVQDLEEGNQKLKDEILRIRDGRRESEEENLLLRDRIRSMASEMAEFIVKNNLKSKRVQAREAADESDI